MMVMPFQVNPLEYMLLVLLKDDNVDRIRQYNPAEINLEALDSLFHTLKLKEIHISYADEADDAVLHDLARAQDVRAIVKHFSRGLRAGFQFKKDLYNQDSPPVAQ